MQCVAGATPQPVSARLFATALPEFFIVARGFEGSDVFGIPDQRGCIVGEPFARGEKGEGLTCFDDTRFAQ